MTSPRSQPKSQKCLKFDTSPGEENTNRYRFYFVLQNQYLYLPMIPFVLLTKNSYLWGVSLTSLTPWPDRLASSTVLFRVVRVRTGENREFGCPFFQTITRVLLRERKRHTARRVASTPCVVLSGGTPSLGTTQSWPGQGVPHPRTRGCPHPRIGGWYPGVPPSPDLDRGYPIPGQGGAPIPGLGVGILGYPPERTWDQWKYYGMEIGYSPSGCGQTEVGPGGRVDSVSTYCVGGLPIKSRQPTSATYVACRECDWPPCWPLYSQQVSHQRWISAIHGTQVTKHASEGSTLALKPRGDIIRSPKQGYQWPHKKDSCPPKI